MPLTVTYIPRAQDGLTVTDTYEDHFETKVLVSGVLKIVIPDAIKVPILGEDGETIMVKKGMTVAIYNGDYAVRRTP